MLSPSNDDSADLMCLHETLTTGARSRRSRAKKGEEHGRERKTVEESTIEMREKEENEVPYFAVSGLVVKFLKVEEPSYRATPWVHRLFTCLP